MFTYINTVSLALSILTPLMLAKVLHTLTQLLKAASRGDFKALAAHAKALGEHSKQIGKLKMAGDSEEEEEEEDRPKAAAKQKPPPRATKGGDDRGANEERRRADAGRAERSDKGRERARSAPARPPAPPPRRQN